MARAPREAVCGSRPPSGRQCTDGGAVRWRGYGENRFATAPSGFATTAYDAWLADFRHRLAQHDAGVALLARDLASRTGWTVRAQGGAGFAVPPPTAGQAPDILCDRGDARPLCFEVEIPETLVRRATLNRLRALELAGVESRVVLVGAAAAHDDDIRAARRMLRRAGLPMAVAAIAPDEGAITGADW